MNNIEFFFEEVDSFKFNLPLLERNALFLANNEKKKLGDVSVICCSDEYLLRINEQYLSHSYYTDIITFDYSENSFISGDLYISVERVRDNAEKFRTSFKNELFRVIIHGLLHLVGYKDKTASEKEEMRKKEDYYLEGIDFDEESI